MENLDIKKTIIVLDGVAYYNLQTINYLVEGMIESAKADTTGILSSEEVLSGCNALEGFISGFDEYDVKFTALGKKVQLVEEN